MHEQHPLQKPATLIVQEVFIPFVFHELRYDHNDAAIGVLLRKVENELNDGNDDEAVRRRQEQQLWRFLACRAEGLLNVTLPVFFRSWAAEAEEEPPVWDARR